MNNRIRIARGTSDKRQISTEKLVKGQLFLETDTQILYNTANDAERQLQNATPINVAGSAKLGTTSGATDATDRQPDHIFEENSNTVKNATKAIQDGNGNNIANTYLTASKWPLQYTKININTFTAPDSSTLITNVTIRVNVNDPMNYGNLYKIVYRNYDKNMVFETYISNQGGIYNLISPATNWTYSNGDGRIRNAQIYFEGNVVNNVLTLNVRLIEGQQIVSGSFVDRINILAIYKVDGYPSIQ